MATFSIDNSVFHSSTGDWIHVVGNTYRLTNPNKSGAITSIFTGGSVITLSGLGSFFISAAPAGLQLTTNIRGFVDSGSTLGSPTWTSEIAGQSIGNSFGPITIPDFYSFTLAWAGLIRVNGSTVVFPDQIDVNVVQSQITGNYIIVLSSATMTPATPVKIGDTIHIHASSKLDGVTEVNLQYLDSNLAIQTVTVLAADFVTQTATDITFLIPDDFASFSGTAYVSVVGNGIQFSGSVWLGPLTIYFADHSGIYVLTAAQHHDILYEDHAGVGPETVNVKIPNPFYKTAYLPPQ